MVQESIAKGDELCQNINLEIFVLNRQKGNMYEFVTHTWNPIRGKCPHNCQYCFMIPLWDRMKSQKQVFDEKTMNDNLGTNNFIFVGSSTDMWANDVPSEWIADVLLQCNKFPDNTYLFQSKNPERFQEFQRMFPKNTILGTTIETNRENIIAEISKAPSIQSRISFMTLAKLFVPKKEIMVTIEPILDFDLNPFIRSLKLIKPKWVNIGADSKGHNLPEPSKEKVLALLVALKEFTEVKQKSNLRRIIKKKEQNL